MIQVKGIHNKWVRINVHLKHLNWVPPKRRGNSWFPDGNSIKIAKRTHCVRSCQNGNVVDRLSQKHMFTNSWLWRQRTTWARQRAQSESLTRLIIIYLGVICVQTTLLPPSCEVSDDLFRQQWVKTSFFKINSFLWKKFPTIIWCKIQLVRKKINVQKLRVSNS